MKIPAPAKINLFLEVVSRRPDGYHNIESIFQAVSLFDELRIEKTAKNISLKCDLPGLPVDERNLIIKAANLLRSELKINEGASISLKKRIPIGAGLGGGSSDAAAAIKGLLEVWNVEIEPKKLLKLAARIGADVPFFLNWGTAQIKGIGDIIKPIVNMGKAYFVLVFPDFGVSTRWVYENLRLPLTKKRKINRIKTLLESSVGPEKWGPYIYNKLEEVVFPKYPEISYIKKKIEDFGYKSLMSGSGSTVFGVVPSLEEGEKLKKKLSSKEWKVWVVESLASGEKILRNRKE